MCSQVSQTTMSSQKLGIAVKSLAYYVTCNVGAKVITTVSETVSPLGAQQDLPTVVLLPIMVGAGLPSMLYFATCRMQLSYKPGAHSGGQLINNNNCWQTTVIFYINDVYLNVGITANGDGPDISAKYSPIPGEDEVHTLRSAPDTLLPLPWATSQHCCQGAHQPVSCMLTKWMTWHRC